MGVKRMKRPNILFVFADQLRYTAVGCDGNPEVKTPNLDRLGAEGMILDEAYAACPICAPYRAQVLTGLYAHQNGVVCNEYEMRHDVPTLPECLRAQGYHTAYVGKWHLGYGPYTEDKRYGFDLMAAYNMNRDAYTGSYHRNEEGPITMTKWHPIEETDIAMDFIEAHVSTRGDDPFFLMMSWIPPHWPYETFPEEYNIYDPDKITLTPNVPEALAAYERKETALYYGNVTGLDDQIGRLMRKLEALGIADDTIVCFSSDHGDHLGAHGFGKPRDQWLHHSKRGSKATPYDESIHIPFLVRWPQGIAPGQRSDAMFSSVDVMPTLLGLCGVDVPQSLAGHDLSCALRGEGCDAPDSVYLQILGQGWPHRGPWLGYWRGVRTHRYVYARWYQNENPAVLFDVTEDPYEMNNLYGKPEHVQVQADMEALLQRWVRETGDPFDTGERDPDTHMLLLGQRFTHEKWNR